KNETFSIHHARYSRISPAMKKTGQSVSCGKLFPLAAGDDRSALATYASHSFLSIRGHCEDDFNLIPAVTAKLRPAF
ncbi:MAG: hypothetical protein ABR903_07895, partial [Thermodesulfovibrionales bacterium]